MKFQVLSFSTKIKRHSLATSAFQWFPPSQVPTKIITTKFLPFCTNAWCHSFRRLIFSLRSRTPKGFFKRGVFFFPSFFTATFYVFQFELVLRQGRKTRQLHGCTAENRKSASFNKVLALRMRSLKNIFHIPTICDPWHGHRRLSSPRVFSTSSHL
jgi:hypothetical protein